MESTDITKTSPSHQQPLHSPLDIPHTENNNNNNNSNTDSENPYVALIRLNMPPVVQPPPATEGADDDERRERGRKWREQKEKELNEKCEQFQSMVDQISSSGILPPSDSTKKKAPTTLV